MIKTLVISESLPDDILAKVEPEVIQTLLANLMAGARAHWIELAASRFTSTRRTYIDGIQEVQIDGLRATVELVGAFPNDLELGKDAFDMHKTLLGDNVPVSTGPGQPGKKVAKDGSFYRSIPFRHQTPSSKGLGGGTPMGKSYEGHPLVQNAGALGKLIHKKAKALTASTGQGQWGGRLGAGLAPKLKAAHSTDIYAGMVRLEKAGAKKTQVTYQTFRTISDKVPDKWLHPGIEAANLSDDVHAFVEKIAGAAFDELFQ